MSNKAKRNIKKIIIFITIMILTISLVPLANMALADEDNNYDVDVVIEATSPLKAGQTIPINVSVKNAKKEVDIVVMWLEYDSSIFEDLKDTDIQEASNWNYANYEEEEKGILIKAKKSSQNDQLVMTINLKVRDNAKISNGTTLKFTDIAASGLGIELNVKESIEYKIGDALYLKSQQYKIGNNNIHEYESGDQYISRVRANTTLADFIEKYIDTNADTVKVYKQNGEELQNNKFVGTGMTLVATKGNQEIRLQIAVMGDTSGEGRVTATDLGDVTKVVLRTLTLQNEYFIAADIDEGGKITASDLSDIKRMILRTYDN